jgi:hypothetical protein
MCNKKPCSEEVMVVVVGRAAPPAEWWRAAAAETYGPACSELFVSRLLSVTGLGRQHVTPRIRRLLPKGVAAGKGRPMERAIKG